MKRSVSSAAILLMVLGTLTAPMLIAPPVARADGFIDFEDGVDGQPIQSSIPGLQFTTTQGYDWIYGDWRTGNYNGPYPDGGYYSNGNFFAWLGVNQGAGRVDFTEGCATYIQVFVSSYYGLTADAYYSDGTWAASASVAGNYDTGELARLRVDAPPGDCFHYVIFHDTGNYWLIDDLSTDASGVPATRPPVILLPGLMGSRLNVTDVCDGDPTDEEVWPAVAKMVVPFNTDEHLNVLKLDYYGQNPAWYCDDVYVNRITDDNTANGAIRRIGPGWNIGPLPLDFYGPMIDHLEVVGFDVYPYGYDWRLDLSDIAGELDAFVDSVLAAHPDASQVNIVDHSLGGLLARYYVTSDTTRADKVEQVVSLGTPFLGAPKALKVLRWGDPLLDPLGIIGLFPPRVRDISQNSPSMYQILPTENYFDVTGQGYYSFDGDMYSWPQTRSLVQTEHNPYLALEAESFHSSAMDDWGSTSPDVAYRLIVGSGIESTPGILHEKVVFEWGGYQVITWDMENTNGDETVPLHSADLRGNGYDYSGGVPTWYANDVPHGDLVTEPYIMDFVAALLATPAGAAGIEPPGSEVRLPDPAAPTLCPDGADRFPEPKNRITVPPTPPELGDEPFEIAGGQIAAFGAVELHVYDSLGNHTGPGEEDRIEIGIPGSSYVVAGRSTFVTVPSGGVYTVVAESRGAVDFDLRIRNLQGLDTDLIQRTVTYVDAPIGSEGLAEVGYDPDSSGSPQDLAIDADGNGIPEQYMPPTGDVGPGDSYDRTPPAVTISLSGDLGDQGWYVGEVFVSISATDSESGLAKLEYSVDGGESIQTYTSPFTVQAEMVSLLVAKATDYAGNEGWATARVGPFKRYMPALMKAYWP